jgi:hypothetical protein
MGAAALPGCLADLRPTTTGYLQVKVVDVAWSDRGRRMEDEVLWAVSDGESELRCRVARGYEGIVEDFPDVRVQEAVKRRLERNFLDVTYVTGFCWRDADGHTCRNTRASRETFNRVQFGDRAEVVFESPGVEVVDVQEDAQGDPAEWEAEITTFDFAARHEGNGAPV